jgi:hypothetical protein
MNFSARPVRPGLGVVGPRTRDPEVIDLDLIVLGAKARPAVIAQRKPGRDRLLD